MGDPLEGIFREIRDVGFVTAFARQDEYALLIPLSK